MWQCHSLGSRKGVSFKGDLPGFPVSRNPEETQEIPSQKRGQCLRFCPERRYFNAGLPGNELVYILIPHGIESTGHIVVSRATNPLYGCCLRLEPR